MVFILASDNKIRPPHHAIDWMKKKMDFFSFQLPCKCWRCDCKCIFSQVLLHLHISWMRSVCCFFSSATINGSAQSLMPFIHLCSMLFNSINMMIWIDCLQHCKQFGIVCCLLTHSTFEVYDVYIVHCTKYISVVYGKKEHVAHNLLCHQLIRTIKRRDLFCRPVFDDREKSEW